MIENRIVLIAHNLRVAGGKSVGQNIVATLPKIAPQHQYLMIVPSHCEYLSFSKINNVKVLECPPLALWKRLWWEQTVMRKAIQEFHPNWIWALGNQAISYPPCRQSLLLHNPHRLYKDESRRFSSWQSIPFRWISDWQMKQSLCWIDRIYCQTETMRKKAHEVLEYDLNKIGLCPNAFSPAIKPANHWPKELEPLQRRFVLFCLTKYYPHKNLENIVETFRKYPLELNDVTCVFTISRQQGKRASILVDSISYHGLNEQIRCIGTIEQERLGEFFHAADVMLLPTLLESFSGTYLEAMQLNTPILTSDRDFAREICGNAAEYIEPLSPESIKDGILRLKNNPDRRKELISNGRNRIQQYMKTWPEILKDVLEQEQIKKRSR